MDSSENVLQRMGRRSAMTLALYCCVSAASGQDGPVTNETCRQVVAGLAAVPPGTPVMVGTSDKLAWKTLFDECDAKNTFAGRTLPAFGGRQLRCSTDPNRVAVLDRYPDGTILFTAKASVDADGSPILGGSGGTNQKETWLTFDAGSPEKFVNAEAVPFIVMPLSMPKTNFSLMKDTQIGKGDLAVAIHGERCSFGVVGDAGPWFRLGEASLRTHADLGNPQCAVAGQVPCRRIRNGSGVGLASGVTYIVFPNSRPGKLVSNTVNDVAGAEAGKRVLQFLASQQK